MKKSKKFGIFLLVLIVICTAGVLLYRNMSMSKISWTEESEAVATVAPSKVHLELDVEEDLVDKLSVETECGTAELDGTTVIWDLSKEIGVARITVKCGKQSLEKTVTVASYMIPIGLDQGVTIEEDDSDDADIDYDGLTNKEEDKLGTIKNNSDSDGDGLNDGDEVNKYKTDPLKSDTDGDGLSDYAEVMQGLNPLKSDSKGDGVKDSKREVEYTKEKGNLRITVTGSGNIAELTTNIETGTGLSNKSGMIDKLYSFKTNGVLKEAVVEISYTDEEVEGLSEEDLSLYYYNVKEDVYEKVDSVVNAEENILSATLPHFSDYVVADSTKIDVELKNNVLFVLDNSWSMYSNEQYKEITGEEYSSGGLFGLLFGGGTLGAYDSEGKRFTLTKELIEKFADSEKISFGLSEFRNDYANMNKVGSNVSEIYSNLDNMNGKFVTKEAGTDIDEAIRSGTDNLKECYGERYLVLLTDGEHNGLFGIGDAIEYAKSYNVKIIAIGFGDASGSSDLQEAARETDGEFFYASDVSGLEDLFEKLETTISSDMVDIDTDGVMDAVIIADSGFISNRDGFNFENYISNKSAGHCYGMAFFSHLYYQKEMNRVYSGGESDYGWLYKLINGSYALHPYNITNDSLENYEPLYNYTLTNNALKYTFGFDYFGEEQPSIIREERKGKFVFTEDVRADIKECGIYDIVETKYEGDTYEITQLNEDKLYEKYGDHDDTQLINALIHYFNNQLATKNLTNKYNFGSELLKDMIGFGSDDGAFAINGLEIETVSDIIARRLEDGEAIVFSWSNDDNSYNHAVNATRLARDLNDPSIYYLYIYDNNVPGVEGVVKYSVENGKMTMLDSENYKLKNFTAFVSLSLDVDLEYFK